MKLNKLKLFFLVCMMMISINQVNAASIGTTMANPVKVNFGQYYTKSWTKSTDHLYHYNEINVTSKGILKMEFSKPFDSEGEYGSLKIFVYDTNGNAIWDVNTYYSEKKASSKYTFYIGLDKGTYYVSVIPGFYVTSGLIETDYRFTFTKTNYTEIESNENSSNATLLNLENMYQAYFGNELGTAGDNDFFKFYLQQGSKYRIIVENLKTLDPYIHLYFPDGTIKKYIEDDFNGIDSNGNQYYEFTATRTGYHYVQLFGSGEIQTPYKIGVYKVGTSIKNANVTLSKTSYVYDGSVKQPSVSVKLGTKTLKSGTDYKVSYKNNINLGTAAVVIEGLGKYKGTINKTFNIILNKTNSFVSNNQTYNSVTLKWNKVSGAGGYEIAMSTSKNGTYKKIASTTQLTVTKKGLTTGKKYYFKVRAYKVVNGQKIYGSYTTPIEVIPNIKTPTIKGVGKSKTAIISWGKVDANGYEIAMSTSKNGTFKKIFTTTQLTVSKKGLTSGKTYYFKVRAYKTVNGVKKYSRYSTIIPVKVK